MGEENGYSWFCWRRSPAYVAAPKEQPELNASPLQRELPSPLQRASGTVLVELVELPVGPVAISIQTQTTTTTTTTTAKTTTNMQNFQLSPYRSLLPTTLQ